MPKEMNDDTISLLQECSSGCKMAMDSIREIKDMVDDKQVREIMDKYYDGKGLVLYANKAFCTLYTCRIAKEEGLGLDVVSGGELYTAIKADFPMEKICFHGNNKTADELEMAVKNNVGHIIVDNIYELELLNKIAEKEGKVQKIMFRNWLYISMFQYLV